MRGRPRKRNNTQLQLAVRWMRASGAQGPLDGSVCPSGSAVLSSTDSDSAVCSGLITSRTSEPLLPRLISTLTV